jgi:Helicase HerA, central domain
VGEGHTATTLSVETPTPFKVSDLLRFISEAMGRLDKPDTSMPYLRLRNRLEALRDDRRFSFMFSDWLVGHDALSQIVGRLLRIPVSGKPLTVMDLSGVPSEIADVVVSLSCRLLFDFVVWSDRGRMPPVLLVCEEAHRYVPADERVGFAATARAITRIAREGRKYGVALALISQRPSELSTQALSQCGTIFALRLANELDYGFMGTVMPDAVRGSVARRLRLYWRQRRTTEIHGLRLIGTHVALLGPQPAREAGGDRDTEQRACEGNLVDAHCSPPRSVLLIADSPRPNVASGTAHAERITLSSRTKSDQRVRDTIGCTCKEAGRLRNSHGCLLSKTLSLRRSPNSYACFEERRRCPGIRGP